jgi:GT2 family glycosyltransferase
MAAADRWFRRVTKQMSGKQSDVAVVVVGMNAREYVRACFASLAAADWKAYSCFCIYVDNDSTDGTVAMMRECFPSVCIIANGRNLGFCVAANQGARLAASRYLMFLNDDTVVIADAIAVLIKYMDAHPDVATAGARLIFPDGREQWSGRRFPNVLSSFLGRRSWLAQIFPNAPTLRAYLCKDQLARGEPFEVDWVSAAGQIFRTADFWSVGGYAEDYYYWHEMVICLRLKRRGKRIALIPSATIVHDEGHGSGPRSFNRQRFHIIDFHRGAFRAYLEQHRLSWRSPRAWAVGMGLLARALVLLVVWRARTLPLRAPARTGSDKANYVTIGRPGAGSSDKVGARAE